MNKKILVLFIVLISVVVPLVSSNDYLIQILIMSGINILLVLSLNLISGFAGQISLGHAAFFGIGAYASALLSMKGLNVWVAIPAAGLVAAILGFLIGSPVLRLRGHFFAIATLGFGEIIHLVLNNWVDVTRGPMGLSGIPTPENILFMDFSLKSNYYYLILVVVLLALYLSITVKHSKMGRALLAIRTDEITAKAMGINIAYYKIFAFTLSAAIAGIAGATYSHFILFLSPETFSLPASINILLMLLIGGIGSIPGSVLGGLFITVLSEYLRTFAQYQMLIYGVLIVLIVIFMPKGLSGLLHKRLFFSRRPKKENSLLLKRGFGTNESTHSSD
ncbi:branched-chain amino acid ABC transporter permease [Aneurinibacillus sp. Ricciae_BoGa-3]|uniref:branched-chain amino acid ABC transporter permease n=1 Tax=Aneurinibacillus sp. Ricciae_BoGa-3 TaxID=3022697 RepID=UPI002340313D|nr:branched-chain amino acid ABC transporter permease [Aneurinibacillus sp. Ricciae_BoGa-3]WCK56364.1 branched-chain amino acid ABC transporter permease [Aneurinibacillus sp. Ricciae_BoGa-3]